MYPMFENLQPPVIHHVVPQSYLGQPTHTVVVNVPQPPAIRPRVRARRGQATDPHSIAERLRRERISEKIKALQELVPSCNKTDRAAMLDEILDYVKFLRLQVKGAVRVMAKDLIRTRHQIEESLREIQTLKFVLSRRCGGKSRFQPPMIAQRGS